MPPPVNPGWVIEGTEFTQRCASIAIWGPTSAGKTTLALTNKPTMGTALLHASEKIAGISQPFVRKGRVVRSFNFGFVAIRNDEDATAKRAQPIWQKWENLYYDAMNNWAGTVIVDTEPDAWALRRFARFGTLNPKGNTVDLYNAVNFDWAQMFKNVPREQATKRNNVSLITIHTASDEYQDILQKKPDGNMQKISQRTGRQKMEGQKSIRYWADVILWVEKVDGKYQVRIDKGWFNGGIEGMVLTDALMRELGYPVEAAVNSALTIPGIMALITETDAGEWI